MAVLASEAHFLFEISGIGMGVADFTAREEIFSPFEVDLTLVSEDEITFDDVIGKEALLTILGDEADRYFHGIINEFMQTGSRGRFHLYHARMVPSMWLLSLEQDCRIFQKKSVPDIVKQVLQDAGITSDRFNFRLQGQYEPKEYCVQYRETDLNFISRLLEEEGVFYFFEHAKDKHLLVFGDSPVNYQPISGEPKVVFNPEHGMVPGKEAVFRILLSRQIRSGKFTYKDFNFEKPSLDLTADKQADENKKLEVYDYPGKYSTAEVGKKLVQIRLQEAVMYKDKAEGESVCPRFIPGYTFTLSNHELETFNQEYLLKYVLHKGSQPQVLEELSGESGFSYSNQFLGIPSSVTLRPERNTPKPVVEGVQTAIVTGSAGEEIYPDEYGRVKVQFHWDREGKNNEKSSCWIRVSQAWAGAGWGAMHIPRIGHEVIVDFIEGDPDRPIITGRVYHGTNKPPYELPAEKTKSTIKSMSSPDGGGFNEIRFEDKKGEEQLFIHAEKNQDIRVKNDCFEWIGHNRHLIVETDQAVHVMHNRNVKVDADHKESVGKDRHLTVAGKEAKEVGDTLSLTVKGDVNEVFKANHSEEVSGDYYLDGMGVVIEATQGITLKCGSNCVVIDQTGVTVKGNVLTLDGSSTMINSGPGSPAGSGKASSAVPPVAPEEALEADVADPGKAAKLKEQQIQQKKGKYGTIPLKPYKPPQTQEEKDQKKSWVEVFLQDEEGEAVSGAYYEIKLPDESVVSGTLDENGLARVEGIDPGSCEISFPNVDRTGWEPK